jgi:pre-mRNA-processing factor 40
MAAATGSDPLALTLRSKEADHEEEKEESPAPSEAPEEEKVVIPPGGWPTFDAAEKAFMHMLKKAGVDENMPWEKVMPKIVMDPLYKSLHTLAEKKNAWAKVSVFLSERRGRNGRSSLNFSAVHSQHRGNPRSDEASSY